MPLTIRKNIENIRDEAGHKRLTRIQIKALSIIQRIMRDDAEFKEFATMYADPTAGPNQTKHLGRLLRTDDKKDDYAVTRALAYLFCNSMCGYSTGKTLLVGVDNELDSKLYDRPTTVAERIEQLKAALASGTDPADI